MLTFSCFANEGLTYSICKPLHTMEVEKQTCIWSPSEYAGCCTVCKMRIPYYLHGLILKKIYFKHSQILKCKNSNLKYIHSLVVVNLYFFNNSQNTWENVYER